MAVDAKVAIASALRSMHALSAAVGNPPVDGVTVGVAAPAGVAAPSEDCSKVVFLADPGSAQAVSISANYIFKKLDLTPTVNVVPATSLLASLVLPIDREKISSFSKPDLKEVIRRLVEVRFERSVEPVAATLASVADLPTLAAEMKPVVTAYERFISKLRALAVGLSAVVDSYNTVPSKLRLTGGSLSKDQFQALSTAFQQHFMQALREAVATDNAYHSVKFQAKAAPAAATSLLLPAGGAASGAALPPPPPLTAELLARLAGKPAGAGAANRTGANGGAAPAGAGAANRTGANGGAAPAGAGAVNRTGTNGGGALPAGAGAANRTGANGGAAPAAVGGARRASRRRRQARRKSRRQQ